MILHFVTDEKFTDYVICQFSAPEMYSEFVLIPSNFSNEASEVKLIDRCKVIQYGSDEFKVLLQSINTYQAIVLHGLFWPWVEDVLKATPSTVRIAWVFWGGEIYSRTDLNDVFLAQLTKIANKLHRLKNSTNNATWELPISLFQKIDFCLTNIEEEYSFAKDYLDHKTIKHIWHSYYSIEDTVGGLIDETIVGDGVLFCNSAAIKNNMFDAILFLSKFKNRKYLGGRKIIMPLSYGDPWVKRAMIKIGRILFGVSFCPILEFLSIDRYNSLMLQCSTLILPYWQPAAQGNIITGLWLGMRVYLSEKSMAYTNFKRIGACIFSLEKDFSKYHYSRLSEAEVETNRAVLRNFYCKEHVMQCARDVVNALIIP